MLALFFTSCQSGGDANDNNGTAAAEEASDMQYTLTPFSESEAYPDAAIEGVTFQDGEFNFGVGGKTYELGVQTPDADAKMCANSTKGQHIHLIIDDQPYAAKYEAAFDYEIEDGDHYMLAFLSRSYHESIKTDKAHVAQKVTIGNNSIKASSRISKRPSCFTAAPKAPTLAKHKPKRSCSTSTPSTCPALAPTTWSKPPSTAKTT